MVKQAFSVVVMKKAVGSKAQKPTAQHALPPLKYILIGIFVVLGIAVTIPLLSKVRSCRLLMLLINTGSPLEGRWQPKESEIKKRSIVQRPGGVHRS